MLGAQLLSGDGALHGIRPFAIRFWCTGSFIAAMNRRVLLDGKSHQVLGSVVVTNPIDVMPVLTREKRPSERGFQNKAMLSNMAGCIGSGMVGTVQNDISVACSLPLLFGKSSVRTPAVMSRNIQPRHPDVSLGAWDVQGRNRSAPTAPAEAESVCRIVRWRQHSLRFLDGTMSRYCRRLSELMSWDKSDRRSFAENPFKGLIAAAFACSHTSMIPQKEGASY